MTNDKKKAEKPAAEAKALSLFLMAFKGEFPIYKEKAKRINRLWDLVGKGELDKEKYLKEVNTMLATFGGYDVVVEKTVAFYIKTTGEWRQGNDDKYSQDAQAVANKILKK